MKTDTSCKAGTHRIGKGVGHSLLSSMVSKNNPIHVNQLRFQVYQGHAGEEVSEYLVSSFPGHLKSDLEVLLAQKPSPDPHDISQLLEEAFQSFDKSMVDDLFSVLPANYERLPDDELRKVINDQHLGGVVYNACIRCMRGSTAIVTLINPEKLHLWTANLGDCQAGVCHYLFSEPRLLAETLFLVLAAYSVDAPDDYKTYLLSNPHNPRVSEREVKRVTSEHPEEPAVIMNHRILGALAVSRGQSPIYPSETLI